MRGCMKELENKLTDYTHDKLDFEVQPIDKLPECVDKLSFLTTSKIILSQVENDRKSIYEQIFLLTKFYDASVNRDKISFDANVKEFAKLVNYGSTQQSKVLKALINNQVSLLLNNINYYAKREMNVRKNISLYLKNCTRCYSFLVLGIQKHRIKDKTVENLTQSVPTNEDFSKQSLPNFYYCKKDLINKIKYINNFSANFIKIDDSIIADCSTSTPHNTTKGDYSL